MKNKFSALIEVRKIIALAVTIMFVSLAFLGRMDDKLIEYIIVAIISYYFAKSTAQDMPTQLK